jgi:nucleoside-diphosphate-sugar epimerase
MGEGRRQGRVVIAGGSGFLGISLATYLEQAGY